MGDKLVLEEDGTEVDEDYLPFVKANTILMLLSKNGQWSDRKSKLNTEIFKSIIVELSDASEVMNV